MTRPSLLVLAWITLVACAADTTVSLSDFDTSCTQDADCTPVYVGDVCGCDCSSAAINVSSLPAYEAKLQEKIPHCAQECPCPALGTSASCTKGVCAPLGSTDAGTCPPGPQAPLGTSCNTPNLTCPYGYNPAVCGGRTVICEGGTWTEQSHSDPQLGCYDGGTDGGSGDPGQSDAGPVDAGACPPGPVAPLGVACSTPNQTCAYGYDPIVCGGRTVICQGGTWAEQSHSDPQPGCQDGGSTDAAPMDAAEDSGG